MAETIRNTRRNFPSLSGFQLEFWLVLKTLPCLWNFRIHSGKYWNFQQFLPSKRLSPWNWRHRTVVVSKKSWQISRRYVFVFWKFNSISPIGHNLSFCEARSTTFIVKCVFVNLYFSEATLDLASQKLKLWPIGLMELDFLKTETYLHEICQLSVIHLQFSCSNFMDKNRFKAKDCCKFLYFPEWILNFHKQGKVFNTNQNSSRKLVT